MDIVEGGMAPPFSLQDSSGKRVELSDFKGKNVILYFYPKDDTPGCTKEALSFRALDEEFHQLNAVVLGVSPDTPGSHEAFRCKYDLPFTLLCDPEKETMKRFGAYGEKVFYGKKVIGVIRSTVWIGPDGTVQKHWPRVARAEPHPAKVLEALRQET